MVRLVSILLVSTMVLLMLQPLLPFADYLINKTYIAEELCENKDKPELKCEGSCHLKKELRASSQSNNEGGSANVESIHNIWIAYVYPDFIKRINTYSDSDWPDPQTDQYSYLFYHKIKQPPRF